jgi:hypothetical protein
MRLLTRPSILLLSGLLLGCGEGPPSNPGTPAGPPHGGTFLALPGGRGVVEILGERVGKPTAKGANSRVLAFFYDAGGAKPLAPQPSDVSVTLEVGGGQKSLALAPRPDAEGGGFASPPGPFGAEQGMSGELTANLAGQPIKVPFTAR